MYYLSRMTFAVYLTLISKCSRITIESLSHEYKYRIDFEMSRKRRNNDSDTFYGRNCSLRVILLSLGHFDDSFCFISSTTNSSRKYAHSRNQIKPPSIKVRFSGNSQNPKPPTEKILANFLFSIRTLDFILKCLKGVGESSFFNIAPS